MENRSTLSGVRGSTAHLTSGVIDRLRKWPSRPLWSIEVQIISASHVQAWTGYAADEAEAKAYALSNAAARWPGFGRCVRSVRRVS